MQEGVYRIYRTFPDGEQRIVARFVLSGTSIQVLEDHGDLMADLVPGGRLNNRTFLRLQSMMHSPYWRLVNEADVEQGFHEDLIPTREP